MEHIQHHALEQTASSIAKSMKNQNSKKKHHYTLFNHTTNHNLVTTSISDRYSTLSLHSISMSPPYAIPSDDHHFFNTFHNLITADNYDDNEAMDVHEAMNGDEILYLNEDVEDNIEASGWYVDNSSTPLSDDNINNNSTSINNNEIPNYLHYNTNFNDAPSNEGWDSLNDPGEFDFFSPEYQEMLAQAGLLAVSTSAS